MPKIRRNTLIEIVPINTGCLNQCTYCKTKHARGDLNSYPIMDLVARVKDVVADGVVEIWLTSEDTGTYGRDHGENIVDLLRQIVAVRKILNNNDNSKSATNYLSKEKKIDYMCGA